MAFSTVPTPLYAIYQRQLGFGKFMITVVFAAYAVGVVISLFLAGHLSDRLGRRRVLLPAVLVEAAAAWLFVIWPTLVGIIVARFLSGLGIGMIVATATAYLTELHLAARFAGGRSRADLLATAANMGGIGIGLVSGLLAQYVTGPLRTPYLVFLVLLLAGAVGVTLVPETVPAPVERQPYRPQRVSVPQVARQRYFAALTAGFTAFAVLGLFTSLAPSFVADMLDQPSRAAAGAVVFGVFGTREAGSGVGEALAGLFLAAYAGLTVPVLALGVATQLIAVRLALLGFVLIVLLVIAAVSRRLLAPQPQPQPQPQLMAVLVSSG